VDRPIPEGKFIIYKIENSPLLFIFMKLLTIIYCPIIGQLEKELDFKP